MNVLVYGFGLMGKKVAQAVRNHDQLNLVGVVSPIFDEEIKEKMFSSLEECHEKVDAIIDFSHPNNINEILKYGVKNHCALIIATTGFDQQQLLKIEEASSQVPIFQSYNTSFGISMLTKIVKEVASICGGGGGGRPDMAQAGAKDASKINEALQNVDEWLKNNL